MAARKKAEDKDPKYGELADELDGILHSIEGGDVDIDDLSAKMERATTLIAACRAKLEATQTRVQKVLSTLEDDEPDVDDEDDEDDED
ncbi:MAG: exodeoxyribonuclease VII small subunit [Planctomycetota bacterium]